MCNIKYYLKQALQCSKDNMAKPRDIPSIEHGLYEAIKMLKDVGIEDAIKNYTKKKKGASFFRSCADPNQVQTIDHADSVAIDYECLITGGYAPMFSNHEAMIAKFIAKNKPTKFKDLPQVMNDLNIIIGEFQTTVHSAQSPSSPGGVKLTSGEKMKVKEAIVKLEQILLHLQIAVGED